MGGRRSLPHPMTSRARCLLSPSVEQLFIRRVEASAIGGGGGDPTDDADGALLGLLQIHSSFIQGHHLLLFCSREGGGCPLQVGVEGPHLLVELGLCL